MHIYKLETYGKNNKTRDTTMKRQLKHYIVECIIEEPNYRIGFGTNEAAITTNDKKPKCISLINNTKEKCILCDYQISKESTWINYFNMYSPYNDNISFKILLCMNCKNKLFLSDHCKIRCKTPPKMKYTSVPCAMCMLNNNQSFLSTFKLLDLP